MARKRKTTTTAPLKRSTKPHVVEHPTPRQGITAYYKSSFAWAESYTSLLMGVVVVIVAVLFVVSLIRATHHIQDTTSTSIGPTPSTAPTQVSNSHHIYTVADGDSLWSIAENIYGSGYNYVDIAKANNLSDPSTIHAGDKFEIPQVTPTVTPAPSELGQITQQENAIKGTSYTVVHDDTLWDIAVRAYADGYRWTDIAKANNLSNPDLIFSGNILVIPR